MTTAKRGVFIMEAGTGARQSKANQRRWVFISCAARQGKAKGLTGAI